MTNEPKLFFIPADSSQPVREVPASEYGELEYGTPTFEYMRPLLGCSTVEHLNVRFQRRHAHLFFDEEGLLKDSAKINERATALYAGTLLWKKTHDSRTELLDYDDLSQPAPLNAHTMYALFGAMVVGDAFLWTGEME